MHIGSNTPFVVNLIQSEIDVYKRTINSTFTEAINQCLNTIFNYSQGMLCLGKHSIYILYIISLFPKWVSTYHKNPKFPTHIPFTILLFLYTTILFFPH